MNASRFDAAEHPAHWRQAVRVDVGRLAKAKPGAVGVHVPGTIVPVGILTYTREDGSISRELVPAETLRDPESLASLRAAPVTIAHPSGGRMVTPETFKRDTVGSVVEGRFDGDRQTAELAIQDAEAMRRVDSGDLGELSAGYTVDIDPTPGTWRGQRYDAIQRNRRYNHIALLRPGQARAGREASLRLDGDCGDIAVMRADEDDRTPLGVPNRAPAPELRADSMKTERIDGIEYEIGSVAWTQARARFDAKQAELLAAAEKRATEAEAALTKERARADGLEAEAKKLRDESSPARIDARAAERAKLFAVAQPILGKDEKLDGLTDVEIRRRVCEKVDAGFKAKHDAQPEAQRETYVGFRFDQIAEQASKSAAAGQTQTALDRARADATTQTHSAQPLPASAFHLDLGDAWRQ